MVGNGRHLSDPYSVYFTYKQALPAAISAAIRKNATTPLYLPSMNFVAENKAAAPSTVLQLCREVQLLLDASKSATNPGEIAALVQQYESAIRRISPKDRATMQSDLVTLIDTFQAQDDAEEYKAALPADAQKCIMPVPPDKISDIAAFRVDMDAFRECLKAAGDNPENTGVNNQAIISTFNYSVAMEERVAERFNEAIRSYKQRNTTQHH